MGLTLSQGTTASPPTGIPVTDKRRSFGKSTRQLLLSPEPALRMPQGLEHASVRGGQWLGNDKEPAGPVNGDFIVCSFSFTRLSLEILHTWMEKAEDNR